MKNLRYIIGVLGIAAAALFGAALPAAANLQVLCAPEVVVGSTGPRTIGGTNSPVPSGTLYSLNGQGCAAIAVGDVGYFLSLGYTPGPSGSAIIYSTGVLSGLNAPNTSLGSGCSTCAGVSNTVTNFQIGALPANSAIRDIIVQNATGNAVVGGIDVGTVNCAGLCGGASAQAGWIVSNLVCSANCLTRATNNAGLGNTASGTPTPQNILSTTVFSQVTPIWISAGTNWNSANVTITILWDYF